MAITLREKLNAKTLIRSALFPLLGFYFFLPAVYYCLS